LQAPRPPSASFRELGELSTQARRAVGAKNRTSVIERFEQPDGSSRKKITVSLTFGIGSEKLLPANGFGWRKPAK